MISQETIQEAIRRLVLAYNPLAIYFYGPYGWGTPDDDDDLNILLVIDTSDVKAHKRGYKAFEVLLGLEIPSRVIVFTKEEFDTLSQDITSSAHEIKNRGKIVYARS